MSWFCYEDVYGAVHDMEFPIGSAPEDVMIVSGRAVRTMQGEHKPKRVLRGPGWPIKSVACGCHPDDRKEFMEDASSKGVPTVFDEQGNAVFRNPSHQRKYLKAYGMHNKDSYY